MTNRFAVLLHPDDVRWAAAEGVSEDVIAAVLLLHQRSVDEIVPKLSAAELEQVIKLVGRSPRVYPPGTLDALKQRKALVSPEPPQRSGESTRSDVAAESSTLGRPALIRGAAGDATRQTGANGAAKTVSSLIFDRSSAACGKVTSRRRQRSRRCATARHRGVFIGVRSQ